MALTPEQTKELKTQLQQQIQHLPEQQKAEALKQIDEMSPEALEAMLAQQQSQQKIFRMIVEGQIPSVKIDENPDALAVLSTKSISEGHTIIIPKTPITDEKNFPETIHKLSEKVSKKLIGSLKAKSTSIIPQTSFAEVVLNIIPIYDKPLSLSSPTTDKSPEELEKLKTKINVEKITKKVEKIKVKKTQPENPLKINRRIP